MKLTIVAYQIMDIWRISVHLTDPSAVVDERQYGFAVVDVKLPPYLKSAEDYLAFLAEELLDVAHARK